MFNSSLLVSPKHIPQMVTFTSDRSYTFAENPQVAFYCRLQANGHKTARNTYWLIPCASSIWMGEMTAEHVDRKSSGDWDFPGRQRRQLHLCCCCQCAPWPLSCGCPLRKPGWPQRRFTACTGHHFKEQYSLICHMKRDESRFAFHPVFTREVIIIALALSNTYGR